MMDTLYSTTIREVGAEAGDLLDAGVLILFAVGAPPELAEVSVLHEAAGSPGACPEGGDALRIADQNFCITAVGETAWQKIAEIGHVVFSFNGLAVAERPGEICVEPVPGERLRALLQPGTALSVIGLA
ncbi:PTS glucitol/sorbitol transporter subunit IIA [Lichenicoccus sp.]|uniref:PTS glucitol/sorbitol transporter subunit IIA n=1 Tax=Lichenicoccus sp. TaxID=2781899 RepID=UPI003D11756F